MVIQIFEASRETTNFLQKISVSPLLKIQTSKKVTMDMYIVIHLIIITLL
jgi:hypothetical protein